MIPFIGPIISAITSFVSTIGPAVARVATVLVTKLPEITRTIVSVAKIIVTVADALGLKNMMEPEELGAKMTQEGTRKRMDNESMEDYMAYLKKEVELDRERLLKMSDLEKVEMNAIGIGAIAQSIQEKTGVEISGDFIVDAYNMKLTADEITAFIKNFEKNELSSMDLLGKFLEGKLDQKDLKDVMDVVLGTEKELNPNDSNAEIMVKIEELKEAIQNSKK